jgi:hypothetical protein
VFGDSLTGARTGISLLSLVLLVVFYRVARRVMPESAAPAVLLLAVNPAFLFYAHSAYMEITVTLLMLIAIHQLTAGENTSNYVGAGIALGLALVTKYYVVTLVAGILLFWLYRYKTRVFAERRWSTFVIAALPLAVWFTAALVIDRVSFLAQTTAWFRGSVEGPPSWRSLNNVKYALEIAGVMTPLIAALGLLGLARSLRRIAGTPHGIIVLFVVCHLVFLAVTPIKDIKYCVAIIPFVCMYAASVASGILNRNRFLAVAVAVALLVTSTPAAHFPNPLDGRWHPNLYLFSLKRDGDYRNYKRAGELIRELDGGDGWLYASERAAIIGYYARIPYRDLWWDVEPGEMSRGFEDVGYVVLNSKSPYLLGEPLEQALSQVRENFEIVTELPGKDIDLTVWKALPGGETRPP